MPVQLPPDNRSLSLDWPAIRQLSPTPSAGISSSLGARSAQRAVLTAMTIGLRREYEAEARVHRRAMVTARRQGMSRAQLYDTIGSTYTATRRTEPRIAERVWAALGDPRTVLNVGAGTGSYEPPGRDVTAAEPSALMRAQRPADAAPCVAAFAERLP